MNDKSLDETLLIFSFLMQEMHRHPSLSPHSAGWWLGNLLTEGGSIPIVPGYVLPHFSLLIRHFPVTSSQNPNFFEMRTTSPVKQYDTAVLPLNLTKCGSALLFMGKHQVVQEETHVSLLVFQESLCAPVPTPTSLCTTDCRTLRGKNQNTTRTDSPLTSKKRNSQSGWEMAETEECFIFF